MNLRTRITLFVVAAAAVGTLTLGSFSIAVLRQAQINSVDADLARIAAQIILNGADPVTEATLAVEDTARPMALGFIAPGTDLVWLNSIPGVNIATPSPEAIAMSQGTPKNTADDFRMFSVELQNGERLVLAASLSAITNEWKNNTQRTLLLWLPFNVMLAWLISISVTRDLQQVERLISAASDIASGEDVAVPTSGTTSEARTLAAALEQLVNSLQQALETERHSNERMQEFLGDASHELRTPLTVVKGYLELLDRPDGLDEQQRERALDRMRTETQRMEVLVNDLLLLAEIGSARPEDLSEVDLTGLVRVMAEDFRLLQPERTVTTNIEAGITVDAVASHLHRAIANAMANIRRHTPADAPVHVDLHRRADQVLLTIEDGGPGLAEDSYAKGIGHFQRFDKSRSRASGGSGLGMSIMAAVVQELGGDVQLRRSNLGGLALDFSLPVTRD